MAPSNPRETRAPSGGGTAPRPGEVYLEFTRVGAYTRCAAIDAATGVEVVVSGPANAARGDLERIAVRKLRRRLESMAP